MLNFFSFESIFLLKSFIQDIKFQINWKTLTFFSKTLWVIKTFLRLFTENELIRKQRTTKTPKKLIPNDIWQWNRIKSFQVADLT